MGASVVGCSLNRHAAMEAGRQEELPALSLCPGMRWAGPFDRFSNPGDSPEADGQTQHRGDNRKTDVLSHGSLLAAP